MKIVRTALAVCVALLAVTAAVAQTGGIRVIVTDSEGLPLPGATVTISHETGSVKTTAELSDRDGVALFPVLRPGGGYSIQVSFPGFADIRYDDLRVKLSESLPVRVQLMEEIQERVKVVADTEVIDLDKSESSTRFSDEFIADLPVPGRFYQNVLTMAPGVQDADGDGNPNVHGSRSRDFQAVVNGVSNVDPLTGQWMSRINTNSIEEMEVITAGAGVEFGRAQGGFARIIQKQGSNEHEGIVESYFRTSKLDGDGARDESDLPTQDFDTVQPGFQFSGPVVKDKLWYRVSYERIDDEVPVNVLSGIEVYERERETQDVLLTWQVSPRNKLGLQFRADPDKQTNLGISNVVKPESSSFLDRDVENWQINWTAPYSPKVLVETTFGWQDTNQVRAATTKGLRNDCVPNASQPFLNSAYCFDLTRNTVSGSWFRDEDDHRQRLTVKGQATVYGPRFWGMTHQFKLGINVENERYFRELDRRPSINFQKIAFGNEDDGQVPDEDDEPTLEEFGLITSTIFVPSADDVRATGTNWAIYAEDQFKPLQNLTITVGARLDREEINSSGRANFVPTDELAAYSNHVAAGLPEDDIYNFFTGYEDIEEFKGLLIDIVCEQSTDPGCDLDTGASVTDQDEASLLYKRRAQNIELSNTNLSPFLSVAWSPWANGKTAFKASIGRYYNNIALLVPLQELEPARVNVQYRASLIAEENCPPPDPDAPDPEVPCGGVKLVGGIEPRLTVLTVDRDLKTPYKDEFSFAFERELWAETSLSVRYIKNQFHDQIQDTNINVAAGDLGACQKQTTTDIDPVVDPGKLAVLTPTGRTYGVCSSSLTRCDIDVDGSCPSGEVCSYDYYSVDPNDFCAIADNCLPAPGFNYGGACQPGDPYCGTPYPDRVAGMGDGFIDPVTKSDLDNCVGDFEVVNSGGDDACSPSDPFCEAVQILRRPDDRTDLYLQNPFWGDIYEISNVNQIDYEAYVLELVRRQYRSWEMSGSYTWSEAKGDGEDFFQELGDDPTLRDNEFGFQNYDQTHVVKLNATTITPWGIRLGSSVTWQSGLPYSLLLQQFSFDTTPPVTSPFAGVASRPRQIYPTGVRNDQRNDAFWNVDLKATKELRLGKGMNMQLSAEVFNVLDDDTYQIVQQINARNFATRRFGRRWQIGAKVSF